MHSILSGIRVFMSKKLNILIYQDEGTDEICVNETLRSLSLVTDPSHFQINIVNSDYLKRTSWENQTKLVVIPGGRSLPYYQKLTAIGNKKISEYVQNGGNYLGICAGAYYGSAKTEFEKGQPLQVICEGELNFFPGIAAGPAYGLGKFRYENYSGAQLANIAFLQEQNNLQQYQIYFKGGNYFISPEQYHHIRVLANYIDIENQPAAIIECRVRNGIAILSGIHIEYSYRAISSNDLHMQTIANALEAAEQNRQELFKKIISRLISIW